MLRRPLRSSALGEDEPGQALRRAQAFAEAGHNETPRCVVGFSVPASSETVPRALLFLQWSAMLLPRFMSFLSKYPTTKPLGFVHGACPQRR